MRAAIQSQADVRTTMAVGRHYVADGLYLQVSQGGGKSWVYRFMLHRKPREMGLGTVEAVTLKEARELAIDARRLAVQGIDPIAHRKERKAALAAAAAPKIKTFAVYGEEYVNNNEGAWKNKVHRAQWRSTLATYAYPVLGTLAPAAITTAHVLKVLQPIWRTKTETASRVRGRIETILAFATISEDAAGRFNPATWPNHLALVLPAPGDIKKVRHHPAMAADDVPAFMARLRAKTSTAARALEFTILTAARTNETIGALCGDIDFGKNDWTRSAAQMKMDEPHRVPLTPRAIEILRALKVHERPATAFVFEGLGGGALSNMTMLNMLGRMGRGDVTVHGFRSTFTDWVADTTEFPRDLAQMALAHAVKGEVEQAYRRGQMLERRRKMMAAWTAFCAGTLDVNLWHGIVLRRYRKELNQAIMRPRTDPIVFPR